MAENNRIRPEITLTLSAGALDLLRVAALREAMSRSSLVERLLIKYAATFRRFAKDPKALKADRLRKI